MATARSWLRCLTIEIPSSDEPSTTATADGDHCTSRGADHNRGKNQLHQLLPEADTSNHILADIRMPEISCGRPSSPGGGACRDTNEGDADDNNAHNHDDQAVMPSTTTTTMTIQRKVCTQRTPPKVRPPPFSQYGYRDTTTTIMDAYNKGMLFSHITTSIPFMISWCWTDTTTTTTTSETNNVDADEYERNWSGHQPLMPRTWSPKEETSSITDAPEKCSRGKMLTSSEIRYRRRRRRRGIWSPRNSDPVMQQLHHPDEHEFFAKRVGSTNGKDCLTASESNT